jgi:ribose transport system ATP-binding protein
MAVIEAQGIKKSYGRIHALDGVDLQAHAGEVHALVGENGAGKSTVMSVLCGAVRPDSGTVEVNGEPATWRSPGEARQHGVHIVFQEGTLFRWLTVGENLLLGTEPRRRFGLIQRRNIAAVADDVLSRFGVDGISASAMVGDLSIAARQVIEIVRAVSHQPRVLLLDEPTSSLSRVEVEWLFGLIAELRAAGTCVIFTSHRWSEVSAVADRFTVFRNGRTVATATELDEREAVRLMTGRSLVEAARPSARPESTEIVLEVQGLKSERLNDVSFRVAAGEIVGIGGLSGQGQRDLFSALFGLTRSTGSVQVDGRRVRMRNPRDAAAAGIWLVPEDRKAEGLLLALSVRENLTLPILGTLGRGGFISSATERSIAASVMDRMSIKATTFNQPVGTLSGGNQQKVLLGRVLGMKTKVLLLYDVTRGVDVATKQEIYRLISGLAQEGWAVLLYSSDTAELARCVHRVLVMADGAFVAEIDGPAIDPEDIVAASIEITAPVVTGEPIGADAA